MQAKIIRLFIVLFFFTFSGTAQETLSQGTEKKIVYFFPGFWSNDIFKAQVPNGFYLYEPLYCLQQKAASEGYDLRVADTYCPQLRDVNQKDPEYPSQFDSIVVFEYFPHVNELLAKYPSEKLVLFLWEPPTTMPPNYDSEHHKMFSRVYTWRDDLVDNKKYFKIFYPVLRPMSDNMNEFEKRKLCVLVAANKNSWVENELYSERRKVIEFFENNHPEDFDLYGGAWPDTYKKTYRGELKEGLKGKVEKLKEYKFAFAYENGKEIPGYITEKIFDCFAAGVVPIYWGAPNIATYIPKNCFIAREEFKDNEELYNHLQKMTKEQYEEYLKNIRSYLASDQAQAFSSDNFVKIMMQMLKRPINANSVAAEGKE